MPLSQRAAKQEAHEMATKAVLDVDPFKRGEGGVQVLRLGDIRGDDRSTEVGKVPNRGHPSPESTDPHDHDPPSLQLPGEIVGKDVGVHEGKRRRGYTQPP